MTAALLDAFRKGEEWALSRVYREYVQKIARYLRVSFTMSSADLQDALQITFMRAFKSKARSAYDGMRPYGNYLVRIAHNVAVNELKKAWRRWEMPPADYDASWLEVVESQDFQFPDALAQNAECRKLLEALYNSLSAKQQKVFDLRYRQELSQDEVASRLKLSRQKVRTIENQIREKAFKFFRNSGYLPPWD